MPRESKDLIVVQGLEEGWKQLLSGEAPEEIVSQLGLDPKEFVVYVKSRVKEISERSTAHEKAFLLGRLEELFRSVWDKRDTDPKWAKVALDILKERREIVLGSTLKGNRQDDAAEIIDLDRVRKVVDARKTRNNGKSEASTTH